MIHNISMEDVILIFSLLGMININQWFKKLFNERKLDKIDNYYNYCHNIQYLISTFNHHQGLIFFQNILIFSNDDNYCEKLYSHWDYFIKDINSYKVLLDYGDLKVVNIIHNEENSHKNHQFNGQCHLYNNNTFNILVNNHHQVIHFENPQNILVNPIVNDSLDQWWTQLLINNHVEDNYNNFINIFNEKKSYIIYNLSGQYHQLEKFIIDEEKYSIVIKNITKEIYDQGNLVNNNQLIQYLLKSINDPIVIFDEKQTAIFINNNAELLFNINLINYNPSMEYINNWINENFINHHTKYESIWLINGYEYQLKIENIGNFTCWIWEKQNDLNVIINENNENKISSNIKKDIPQIFQHNIHEESIKIPQKYFYKSHINNNISYINDKKIIWKNGYDDIENLTIMEIIQWIIHDVYFLCQTIMIINDYKNSSEIHIKIMEINHLWQKNHRYIMDNIMNNYKYLFEMNNITSIFYYENEIIYIKLNIMKNINKNYNTNYLMDWNQQQIY